MKFKTKYIALIAVAVIVLSAIFLVSSYTGNHSSVDVGYDDFAQCLSDNGVVMYGTRTCGVCSMQKEVFGDSFQYVNYIAYNEDPDLFHEKNISSVPTWEIDGEFHVGLKTIEQLSDLTGCALA